MGCKGGVRTSRHKWGPKKPKPYTANPNPYTLNPKPSSRGLRIKRSAQLGATRRRERPWDHTRPTRLAPHTPRTRLLPHTPGGSDGNAPGSTRIAPHTYTSASHHSLPAPHTHPRPHAARESRALGWRREPRTCAGGEGARVHSGCVWLGRGVGEGFIARVHNHGGGLV